MVAVEADGDMEEDLDVVAVVVVAALVVTFPTTITPLHCLFLLLIKVLLKGILGIPLKGVVMVHLVLLTASAEVAVVVEDLATVKVVKKDVHEGHLIATAGLDEGNITILLLISVFKKNIFQSLLILPFSICRGGFKREGAGRGNWGTQSDEIAQ